MFPHIRQKMVENLKNEHQLAIEEKEADLQVVEYENIEFQGRIQAKDEEIKRLDAIRSILLIMGVQLAVYTLISLVK